MRKFTAKTHVCLSVPMKSGKNVHVSFQQMTGGGSVYYTDDENLADALVAHHKYGKLFKEEAMPVKVSAPSFVKPVQTKDMVKEFACLDDAKDFFAEKYSVSRSKMKTKTAIEDVALNLGIKISWAE
jgi:hypothetical protein